MEVRMEEILWGSLPEHILDRVLTMLPVKSLFRFRAVCKRWNAFPSSHSFLDACSSSSSSSSSDPTCCETETWLVVTNSHRSFAYNPYSKKLSNLTPPLFQDLWYSDFLASSEGLILCASSSSSSSSSSFLDDGRQAAAASIHIFNPFTGFLRQLPEVGRPCAAQILMDPSGHGYRIVALCLHSDTGSQERRWSLESYDSVSDCWQVLCSKIPVEIMMQDTTTMVVCNEIVYCAIGIRVPFDLWEFHFQTSAWYRVGLPALAAAYTRYHLVGCQGRLLLVARIKEQQQQNPDARLVGRIHVWKLEQSKKTWTHMLDVPDEMLDQMGSRGWALSCCAYGDLLILIFKDMLWTKILVYNFATDQIHCGPCLYTVLSTTEFLFYPRLSALV